MMGKGEDMRTEYLLMLIVAALVVAGTGFGEDAVKDAWIKPWLKTDHDNLIWGCRLKNCSHVGREIRAEKSGYKKAWKHSKLQLSLVENYVAWFEADGQRIQNDWRKGAVKPKDEKYLPLVKTEFWNRIVNNPGGPQFDGCSRGYGRWSRLKKPDTPEETELQAILEAGLEVLHKIYNHQELTAEDKNVFHEWAIAYYCIYFIGAVSPYAIPGDSWATFGKTLTDGDPRVRGRSIKPGDRVHNFKVLRTSYWWDKPGFDPAYVDDNCWHLKPERLDDLIATYCKMAKEYESTETYPIVKPRDYPEDTQDTEQYFFFHNYMKREKKPVFFSHWFTKWDESNDRGRKFVHLYYRAFKDHINFLFAEEGYTSLIEKNDLIFNMDEEARARRILHENIAYSPMLPTTMMGFRQGLAWRAAIINKEGNFVCLVNVGQARLRKGNNWDDTLAQCVGNDAYMVKLFKNGFQPDPAIPVMQKISGLSKYGRCVALSEANGYNMKPYDRYANMYDAIGHVVDVDTTAHTLTMLREEFHSGNYPNLALLKKFNISAFRKFQTYVDYFERCEKAGNSVEARTMIIKLNEGVITFLNGEEVNGESGFKKGDIISVMTEADKEYPYIIRGFRLDVLKQ